MVFSTTGYVLHELVDYACVIFTNTSVSMRCVLICIFVFIRLFDIRLTIDFILFR